MPLFLIVEDDPQIRNFIKFSLKSQDYNCIEASTGQEAKKIIMVHNLSGIILDLGLPDMDGVDLIKEIREFSTIPIIVVSARDQIDEKIEALDSGADDYLTKPFSIEELLARIRVAMRHSTNKNEDIKTVYKIGDLEVDLQKHKVTLEGKEIHFTPMEFDLLSLLVKNAGKVLTHKYILKEIWGSTLDSDTQTLRVFMANIRRKLEKNPTKSRYIITEVGVGYRFADK